MAAKRVLSVGQCSADHAGISSAFQRAFGAEVIVPLYARGEIIGWLFFGHRITGLPFEYGDLEGLMVSRLRAFFADPSALLDIIDGEASPGSDQRQLIEHGRQIAGEKKHGARRPRG